MLRIRQYKTKIAGWGSGQHNKVSGLKYAASRQEKRKREAGLETVIVLRNSQLEDKQLERFKEKVTMTKRLHPHVSNYDLSKSANSNHYMSSAIPQGVESSRNIGRYVQVDREPVAKLGGSAL